jgi:hypothetical protein
MVIPLATDDASPEVTSAIESFSSLDQLQAASVNYRIAIDPHAGRKALTLYSVPPIATKRLSVDWPLWKVTEGPFLADCCYKRL